MYRHYIFHSTMVQILNISTSFQSSKVCFYRCLLRWQGDIELSALLKEMIVCLAKVSCLQDYQATDPHTIRYFSKASIIVIACFQTLIYSDNIVHFAFCFLLPLLQHSYNQSFQRSKRSPNLKEESYNEINVSQSYKFSQYSCYSFEQVWTKGYFSQNFPKALTSGRFNTTSISCRYGEQTTRSSLHNWRKMALWPYFQDYRGANQNMPQYNSRNVLLGREECT